MKMVIIFMHWVAFTSATPKKLDEREKPERIEIL